MEKNIFHDVCDLLTINIEPIFVFDGPDVPPKRNRKEHSRKVDYKKRALLKQILRGLDVHYIEALGEAEAECCQLQSLGLVDAVWSQYSDCLMFGCGLWIRTPREANEGHSVNRNKGHTRKVKDMVRVVVVEDMRARFGLTRENCVLYAMLAGGDYGKGLLGCGHTQAAKAAQSDSKLGSHLCEATNQDQCATWRNEKLLPYLEKKKFRYTVPADFPNFELFEAYNKPKVHAHEGHDNFSMLKLSQTTDAP